MLAATEYRPLGHSFTSTDHSARSQEIGTNRMPSWATEQVAHRWTSGLSPWTKPVAEIRHFIFSRSGFPRNIATRDQTMSLSYSARTSVIISQHVDLQSVCFLFGLGFLFFIQSQSRQTRPIPAENSRWVARCDDLSGFPPNFHSIKIGQWTPNP